MIYPFRLIRSQRRSMALIIQPDGSLLVRAPLQATDQQVLNLVHQKEEWIRVTQEKVRRTVPKVAPRRFAEGETFLFKGNGYRLKLVNHARPTLSLGTCFQLDRAALPRAKEIFTRWYRQQARQVIEGRVSLLAAGNGFHYEKIRISSARTRWGSCSAKGTLSFTWRLVMAPLPVIDYVVMHELVHLHEHNHSKSFWAKVAKLMPGYKQQMRWLKENGRLLTLD